MSVFLIIQKFVNHVIGERTKRLAFLAVPSYISGNKESFLYSIISLYSSIRVIVQKSDALPEWCANVLSYS